MSRPKIDITKCARCGQRAVGFAFIGDRRYCHDGSGITCYMIAQLHQDGR